MTNITFNCPECNSLLEVDASGAGRQVNCPQCSKLVWIPIATPRVALAAPPPVPPTAQPKTPAGAIWSLVLGILGLICFGPLAAIPAVICGHITLGRIKRSGGELTGNGMALAGLITGYVGIALMLIWLPMMAAIAIPSFVKARNESQKNCCINNLRMMNAAKEQTALEQAWPIDKPIVKGSPEMQSVLGYLISHQLPACPAGGTYGLNAVGRPPTCNIPQHELPSP